MRNGRGSRKPGSKMDGEETGTANIKTADSTYKVSADIIDNGGNDGGRNNTRRKKSDDTIKHLCI